MARLSHGTPVRHRPRIFYGWYIVGASILLNSYFSVAVWQGFTVFFLPILRDFGVSRTVLSGAFSLRQIESGFLSPVVGYLVDRVGPRKVILVGVIITGAGMVLISFSSNISWFYIAFAIVSAGISGASHGVSWAVMVAHWFKRQRGRATSLAYMGGAVGGPGVILLSMLVETIGWRPAVLGLGLGIWIIGVPLSLVARSRPEDYGYLPDGDYPKENDACERIDPDVTQDRTTKDNLNDLTLSQAIKTRSFWALVGIFAAIGISSGGLAVHQIAYFQDIGFTATRAASTVAIAFGVSAVGRLTSGVLMDSADWRYILAAILIGQCLALLILTNVTVYWHAVLFAIVLGLFHGMLVPARPIIVSKLFGTSGLGSIWGCIDGCVVAAGVVAPIYLGWTFDMFNTYVPALYVLMALLLAAIPIIFIAFKKRNDKLYMTV